MRPELRITPCELPESTKVLRQQVREFLAEALVDRKPADRARSWMAADPQFSRALGARGWIGMTWPTHVGGQGRSALERYVVLEELLAAGAPVAAHWVADRQSGPLLLRYSPQVLAPSILPDVARGEVFFCIGMSEPGSGSDLASIRSTAQRIDGGWVLNGAKVWTSGAHYSRYMIALVRTATRGPDKHAGLSQFLVDMHVHGVTVKPIRNLHGEHDFNEVLLDGVEVPDDNLIGTEGEGWRQVTEELSIERSGPERYLSSVQLMAELLRTSIEDDRQHLATLGRLVARHSTLRQMSLGVAGLLQRGVDPALAATMVKELGANLEQDLPEAALALGTSGRNLKPDYLHVLDRVALSAPSFSLRGGSREILRGIIARGMGLR